MKNNSKYFLEEISREQLCLFQSEHGYCRGKFCKQYEQCFPSGVSEKISQSALKESSEDCSYDANSISNSVVVQANRAEKIIIVSNIIDGKGKDLILTEDETELFAIYRSLRVKARASLLNTAYELAEDPIINRSFNADDADNNTKQ